MNTYLTTWNPKNWAWTTLEEDAVRTVGGERVVESWSCGNTKRIVAGDRLFLLKQGAKPPKGIMASGLAVSDVYEAAHWDEDRAAQGEKALHVGAEWDVILNPENEPLLPVSVFQDADLPSVHWNTQSSGILIPPAVAERMETLWARHVASVRGSSQVYSFDGDDLDGEEFPEGRVLFRLHRIRERNSNLVKEVKALALERFGKLECVVCQFDFFRTYGEVGKEFIECHHTVPVSELTEGMKTKLSDMALVCSNCHRMLHRKRPWLRISDLKALLRK